MPFYPSIKVEIDCGAGWVDRTADVVGRISAHYGANANGPLDLVATPGEMRITLRNDERNLGGVLGYYSPGHPDALEGFQAGAEVRIIFFYEIFSHAKFKGTIPKNGIEVTPGKHNIRTAAVTVKGWLHFAALHEVELLEYAENKHLGEHIQLVLDNMPVEIQPAHTDLQVGQDTFPAVFDAVRFKTPALREMAKGTFSELGRLYVKRDRLDGETLVAESRFARSILLAADVFPVAKGDSGALIKEDGGYILLPDGSRIILNETTQADFFPRSKAESGFLIKEDGGYLLLPGGGRIALSETEGAVLSDSMALDSPAVSHAPHLANYIEAFVYPKKIDTNPTTVLFELDNPIQIGPQETITNFKAGYKDPVSKSPRVNGKDIQDPTAGADYVMNSAADGSGIDLTGFLVVTIRKGAESSIFDLENTSDQIGFVTTLKVVGRGITRYNPAVIVREDQASMKEHGKHTLRYDMLYQDDPEVAKGLAETQLSRWKEERSSADEVFFYANRAERLILAFMFLDIGSRVFIREDVTGVSGNYYINGVEFSIDPGGFLTFKWYVEQANLASYWVLGTSQLGISTALAY